MKSTAIFTTLFLCVAMLSCDKKNDTGNTDKGFTLDYEKFTLDNGLEVILHVDKSDPIVAVATVMHVGSIEKNLEKLDLLISLNTCPLMIVKMFL